MVLTSTSHHASKQVSLPFLSWQIRNQPTRYTCVLRQRASMAKVSIASGPETDHMPNLSGQPIGFKSTAQTGLAGFILARTACSDKPKFTRWNPKCCADESCQLESQ